MQCQIQISNVDTKPVSAAFEALMFCFVDGCVSHSQTNQHHAGRTLRHLLQWRLCCSAGYGYTKSAWLWHMVNQRNGSTTALLEEYCIKTPPWQNNSQRCNFDLGSCSRDFRDGQESPFSCQEIALHTSYYIITLCLCNWKCLVSLTLRDLGRLSLLSDTRTQRGTEQISSEQTALQFSPARGQAFVS